MWMRCAAAPSEATQGPTSNLGAESHHLLKHHLAQSFVVIRVVIFVTTFTPALGLMVESLLVFQVYSVAIIVVITIGFVIIIAGFMLQVRTCQRPILWSSGVRIVTCWALRCAYTQTGL